MTDLPAGNPAVSVDGNPSAEPSSTDNGISTQNGEAKQGATIQETFIPEGLDVNTLPQNVRAIVDKINKDMVRGFTEKTSKLSETIKSEVSKHTESLKSKAELYDQIATQEEFVKQWNDYVNKVKSQPATADNQNDPKLKEMETKLQEMSQKMQLAEMSQITEAFADAVDEKGNKIHQDFDSLNSLPIGTVQNGDAAEEYSLLRACVELAPGKTPSEKLSNGYKAAKQTYDSIFELGKRAGLGKLRAKVQHSSQAPENAVGDIQSVTEKKPRNAHEAMELARKGIMVTRD